MHESTGVFILPIFKLDILTRNDLGAMIAEDDLLKLESVMHRNLVDICEACGIQKIYSLGQPQDFNQHDIFGSDNDDTENAGLKSIVSEYIEREIKSLERVVLVNENIVGLTPAILNSALNLLELEEDVNVILFDKNNRCCGSLFLNYSSTFLDNCLERREFDKLFKITNDDRFWITMNNMHSVASATDFKNLYMVLSDRGNIDFCRKEFYDTFTELFIEYKELLK